MRNSTLMLAWGTVVMLACDSEQPMLEDAAEASPWPQGNGTDAGAGEAGQRGPWIRDGGGVELDGDVTDSNVPDGEADGSAEPVCIAAPPQVEADLPLLDAPPADEVVAGDPPLGWRTCVGSQQLALRRLPHAASALDVSGKGGRYITYTEKPPLTGNRPLTGRYLFDLQTGEQVQIGYETDEDITAWVSPDDRWGLIYDTHLGLDALIRVTLTEMETESLGHSASNISTPEDGSFAAFRNRRGEWTDHVVMASGPAVELGHTQGIELDYWGGALLFMRVVEEGQGQVVEWNPQDGFLNESPVFPYDRYRHVDVWDNGLYAEVWTKSGQDDPGTHRVYDRASGAFIWSENVLRAEPKLDGTHMYVRRETATENTFDHWLVRIEDRREFLLAEGVNRLWPSDGWLTGLAFLADPGQSGMQVLRWARGEGVVEHLGETTANTIHHLHLDPAQGHAWSLRGGDDVSRTFTWDPQHGLRDWVTGVGAHAKQVSPLGGFITFTKSADDDATVFALWMGDLRTGESWPVGRSASPILHTFSEDDRFLELHESDGDETRLRMIRTATREPVFELPNAEVRFRNLERGHYIIKQPPDADRGAQSAAWLEDGRLDPISPDARIWWDAEAPGYWEDKPDK